MITDKEFMQCMQALIEKAQRYDLMENYVRRTRKIIEPMSAEDCLTKLKEIIDGEI